MNSWKEYLLRRVLCGIAAAAIPGGLPSLALAEESNANVLEEIVVTAQRRTETLQSVPIAVTALRSEDIRKADIHTLEEISMRTPGFTTGSYNKGQPQLYIRGIGSNADGAGADPSVVVFLDEVYIGRGSGAVFDLYDLERVEVLRGPQGTLFGKNATGGVISIHTTEPSDTFYGQAEVSAGNLDAQLAKVLVSGPISDNVYGKLSGSYRKRDGYVETLLTDESMSDQDTYGLRGALRFVPSDTLEIQLNADYSESDETAFGRILLGDSDPSTPDLLWAAARAYDPEAADDHFTTFADEPGAQETEIGGTSVKVDWEVAGGTFTSITAFRASEFRARDDIVVWDLDVADIIDGVQSTDEESEQFSQEFRLAGYRLGDRLQWVAGLYYLREEAQREENNQAFVRATVGLPVGQAVSMQDNTTVSASLFGDATYDLSDTVSLAIGARYTYEDKDIHQVGLAPLVIAHTIDEDYEISAGENWDAFTPRIALEYQASDSVLLYGSVSRGFKSGGFAGTAPTATAAMTPFDPEYATAYEVGAKTELLDRRLRVNTALFTTDYEDLQVLVRKVSPGDPLGILVTENAADATSEGFELEFEALLFEGFTLSGSYAYLNAEYDKYLEPSGIDNAGNPLRNSPENVFDIVASYSRWLSSGAELGFRFEYFHTDEAFQEPRANPSAAIPGYELANLRLSYTAPSGDWEFAIWSKNLFDEEYLLHNLAVQPFGNTGVVGPPRTYGATVTTRFGDHH